MFALLEHGKLHPPNFEGNLFILSYKSVYCCIVSPNFLTLHHPAGTTSSDMTSLPYFNIY